ncbi:hypothetical protein Pan97_06950 [Bremerella volcania]|uniref:Uncharacterized protein n=1 Tax=Bremerella volcania TaxID=2527984 RepID=A0A518C397_9BACT|nr:hypothetical protein Pan97_06950 [Bremerella volcania]
MRRLCLLLSCLAFSWITSPLFSHDICSTDYVVAMHEYPPYNQMENFLPPPQNLMRVPYLHTPTCPPTAIAP